MFVCLFLFVCALHLPWGFFWCVLFIFFGIIHCRCGGCFGTVFWFCFCTCTCIWRGTL